MIFIQCILLKVSLAYRPDTYNPDALGDPTTILDQLSMLPPVSLVFESDSIIDITKILVNSYLNRAWHVTLIWGQFILSLFDVHYKRPGLFWQWHLERRYWRFLEVFTVFFGVLTLFLKSSPMYGVFLGTLGLFIEALLPLPQIMMIHRLQSVSNFKVILLVSWLAGDCLKLSYLFFGTDNVLSIFFMAAFFQMSLDLIILCQYIHYSNIDDTPLPLFHKNEPEEQGIEMDSLGVSAF